jgi:prepilin-type N-terminal cleavage/methylation domain-containing protein
MRSARDSPSAIRHSRGFTLVELLIVMAIIAIVTGTLAMIFYQFSKIPRWGNAQLAVDNDLRNVGMWLMRDGNESASFTSGGSCGTFTAPSVSLTRTITYTYSAAENTLNRQDSGTSQTTTVARNLTSVQCPAGVVTGTVVFLVTAASGDVSASQTYTVTMRVQ